MEEFLRGLEKEYFENFLKQDENSPIGKVIANRAMLVMTRLVLHMPAALEETKKRLDQREALVTKITEEQKEVF